MILIFIIGFILGLVVGRWYAWMKYHYPEFQEEIRVKVAKQRLRRLEIEAKEEDVRAYIDRSLDRRING